MKIVLVHNTVKEYKEFKEILQTVLSEFKVVTSDEIYNYNEVEFVVIWYEIPKDLHRFSNLKLILNCGSGFDQYLRKLDFFDKNIPIVRLVDPYLKERVSNYISTYIAKISSEKLFSNNHVSIDQKKIKIVIMGIGILGSHTALKLLEKGYEVIGWSKSEKYQSLYRTIIGKKNLYSEIRDCNFLVCQLPLTSETENVINAELLENLNREAVLINVGRGEHIVENDLVEALEKNKIAGAVLDVNRVEPIPESHIYNHIKNIIITPHIAGYVGANTQSYYAASVIKNYLSGNDIEGVFDFKKQY